MVQARDLILRIHRFLPETAVEGPGRRAALWVQGCPIQCPGCANGESWSFDGGCEATVGDLFNQIREQQSIEGVTFIGGEPFSQALALAELGRMCRGHGLSVVTFSGYTHARLVAAVRPDWNALLSVTDLLLAGPWWLCEWGSEGREFKFHRFDHLQTLVFLSKIQAPASRTLAFWMGKKGILKLTGE